VMVREGKPVVTGAFEKAVYGDDAL